MPSGASPRSAKIVVAVDFGTTYSGLAWAVTSHVSWPFSSLTTERECVGC